MNRGPAAGRPAGGSRWTRAKRWDGGVGLKCTWLFFFSYILICPPPPSRLQQQQSYGSVMCSLMGSPCLEGWLGEVVCDGWVPGGRVWVMGTPPGINPSIGPGIPPGATPTTPGGNLETDRRRSADATKSKGKVMDSKIRVLSLAAAQRTIVTTTSLE